MTALADWKQRPLRSYHGTGDRRREQNTPVPCTPAAISSFIHFTEVRHTASFEVLRVESGFANLFCFVLSEVVSKKPTCWKNVRNLKRGKQSNNDSMSYAHLDFFLSFLFEPKDHDVLTICDPSTTYWFMNDSKQNSHKFTGATSTTVTKSTLEAINQ